MIRYVILLLIVIVPLGAVDEVVSGIEATTLRMALRVVLIFLAVFVARLIPPPAKNA